MALDYGAGVKVLLAGGGGYFERSYRAAEEAGQVTGVEAADWNGDALPDLLLAAEQASGWSVWLAAGSPLDQRLTAEVRTLMPPSRRL